MEQPTGAFLGLDFGTSTTLVALSRGVSGVEVVPIGKANEWLPSLVGIPPVGQMEVGEDAERLPAHQVIRSVKTAITRREEDVSLGSLTLQADEVASAIIREALTRAEWQGLRSQLAGVRAGCPAMWDREQRTRLQRILGGVGIDLELSDIIDEPIAAAIGWINQRRLTHQEFVEGRLVVFDYGGGTLDIAVCDVQWVHGEPEVTVLACNGWAEAGDVLDQRLFEHVRVKLAERGYRELSDQQQAAVVRAARLAKEELSWREVSTLSLEPFGLPNITLNREELEGTFREILDAAISMTFSVLKMALLCQKDAPNHDAIRRMRPDELVSSVDFVLLAGGMSQIPLVGERMQQEFSQARIERIKAGERGALRSPQHLIAGGLVLNPQLYDRLNLHRPAFNLVLEWKEPSGDWRTTTLYSSYNPLYSPDALFTQYDHLSYRNSFRIPDSSRTREGMLSVFSDDGQRLPLRLGKETVRGLRLEVRPGAHVKLTLYLDGRMIISIDGMQPPLTTGAGGLRIKRWQVLRDANAVREIELSDDEGTRFSPAAYPLPYPDQ